MKYSVIIPCYDATEEYFRRCLDSIKNQTLQPYEVICVDDASPLDTPQLAKEYGYKYIRHKENLNNGGARNTGIKAATGDYLVFVNSDDYILPETLEEIDKVNKGQDLILIGFRAFGSYYCEGIPNESNTPYISKLAVLMKAYTEDAMEALIKAGIDVNAKDNEGMTALMHLGASTHPDNADILIKGGADVPA